MEEGKLPPAGSSGACTHAETRSWTNHQSYYSCTHTLGRVVVCAASLLLHRRHHHQHCNTNGAKQHQDVERVLMTPNYTSTNNNYYYNCPATPVQQQPQHVEVFLCARWIFWCYYTTATTTAAAAAAAITTTATIAARARRVVVLHFSSVSHLVDLVGADLLLLRGASELVAQVRSELTSLLHLLPCCVKEVLLLLALLLDLRHRQAGKAGKAGGQASVKSVWVCVFVNECARVS
jgi:hypothetical protein